MMKKTSVKTYYNRIIAITSVIILVISLLSSLMISPVVLGQQEALLKFCIPSPGRLVELNPYFYVSSPPLTHGMFLKFIYETLAEERSDGSLEPLLAQSWNVSPDGKIITIKLRPNVLWHDGVPFTARDVAFVLATIKKYPYGDVYSIGKYIDSIETPDNLTVVIKLSQPFSRFLYYVLTGYRIFPEHIYKDVDFTQFPAKDPRYVVGTGPFRLVEANYDTQVFKLRAFEKYWGGSPYIKDVVVQIVDESAPIPIMLKTGQCSIAAITNPVMVSSIVTDPNLRIAVARGWPYQGSYYTPAGLLVINTAIYPLNITEFRRALAYAINKERIIQLALQGQGVIASSGQLPMDSPWRPKDLPEITYNVTKAREILKSLGFVEGPDKMFRYPNGSLLSIKIIHTGGLASNVVPLIIQDLRNAGIDASEEVLTRLAYVNDLSYGYYQVAMLLTNRPTDVDFVLTVFMDRNLTPTPIGQPTQYWGWTRYVNPEFNSYIEKARLATSEEEAFKYYAKAQEIAARDQWVIPLYYSKAIWAFNVKDFSGWDKLQAGEGFPTHLTMLSVRPYQISLTTSPTTSPPVTTVISPVNVTATVSTQIYTTYIYTTTLPTESMMPIIITAAIVIIIAIVVIALYMMLRRKS